MTARRTVAQAIEQHGDDLSAFPNVVGIGMTESVDDDRPSSLRTPAVAVYVTEKQSAEALGPAGVLPGFVEIDDHGEPLKVPVKVIEMGTVELQRDSDDDTDIPSDEGGDGSTFSPQ